MKAHRTASPARPGSRQQRDSANYAEIDQLPAVKKLRRYARPRAMGFQLRKIGHVVLNCRDIERSIRFYTEVLGFELSDVYPEEMMPGGMAFLRCNPDHHGIGLVGSLDKGATNTDLNHIAFEVGSLDEVLLAARRLRKHGAVIDFEGRRRAGVQIAVEFLDPDGHNLEIYWGLDQIGADGVARPANEWRGAKSLEEAVANPPPGQVPVVHDKSLLVSKS